MKQLTLSEIYIYPVKSLGGIAVQSARIFEKGLQYDRRWMLTDENGVFMTQRVHPKMALLKVAIDHGKMTIRNLANQQTISFHIDTGPVGDQFRAVVWDDEVQVVEVDPFLSQWFSDQLGLSCRFVAFPEDQPRPVDANFKVNDEHVSLADAYPFLIIGQSSLDDLNNRLAEKVSINRFRPNFVFTGGQAFEEDNWRNFSIAGNRFVGVKNCARCVLTTVNQETGEKGVEPLQTLSQFRRRENKIYFGQNVVAIDLGEIAVGDPITLS